MKLKTWKEIKKAGLVEPASSLKVKTGDWKILKPVIDNKKCIKCFKCVVYCPDFCIAEKEGKITPDYDYCKGCGVCAKVCPVKAIAMEKAR
jgi:pyruvate ferredoxin oxidoreductase delta subunit